MELGHILGFFLVPAMAGTSLKNPHWGSSSQILDERCRFRMVQIMISGDKVGLIFGLPSHDYLVGGCHPSEKIWISWEYIWNSQYMGSHQIPWFQTTNQLLMINSCWYHHWGCWWLPEIGEKSTASESASIPTNGICECSSTSTSLWNHIETTSKPHWNYHSTCIVSEGFFGHVDVVLWLHLQHLHPARFFV